MPDDPRFYHLGKQLNVVWADQQRAPPLQAHHHQVRNTAHVHLERLVAKHQQTQTNNTLTAPSPRVTGGAESEEATKNSGSANTSTVSAVIRLSMGARAKDFTGASRPVYG